MSFLTITTVQVVFTVLALLPAAAFDYKTTSLPTALKQHDLVLVAKVIRRAEGKVSLMPELIIKGPLDQGEFELPETWSEASKWRQPVTLLERKRYLLMLNRDGEGKPVFSKDPLAESVQEASTVDDTHVRTSISIQRLIDNLDAAARTQALDRTWIEESDKVKQRVLTELLQMGPDEATVPFLVRCIKAGAERSSLMELSSIAIGKFKYQQTAPALLELLKKDDWACIYPAKALGQLKVREAYEPLKKLIASPIAGNRVYFIKVLCELDDERSIPFLIETARRNLKGIDSDFGTYRSFDIRENESAVAFLGRIRAKQALGPLREIARETTHVKLKELAQQAIKTIRASQ